MDQNQNISSDFAYYSKAEVQNMRDDLTEAKFEICAKADLLLGCEAQIDRLMSDKDYLIVQHAKTSSKLTTALELARQIIVDHDLREVCETEVEQLIELGMQGWETEHRFSVTVSVTFEGRFVLAEGGDADCAVGELAEQMADHLMLSRSVFPVDGVTDLEYDQTDWSVESAEQEED